jgi:hypothetical protein
LTLTRSAEAGHSGNYCHSSSQSEPDCPANPPDNPNSGADCDANTGPSIDDKVLGDNSHEHEALCVKEGVPELKIAPKHASPPISTRPLPRRPSVPRRPRAVGLPVTETPGDRVKQVTALASVMTLIVLAGIALLPATELAGADCAAKPAKGVNWSNCRFENLDLTRAKLVNAILRSTRLNNVQAVGMQLSGAVLAFAGMAGENLAYVDLESANAVGANFHNADLSYASLRGTDFSYAVLSRANLGAPTCSRRNLIKPSGLTDEYVSKVPPAGVGYPSERIRRRPNELAGG